VHLLSAAAERRAAGVIDPTVLVVGTSQQYGRHDPAAMPLTESAEQRPITVYGASKSAQEIAALQFHRALGLRVICTRSFNHSGVGHGPDYLIPALVGRVLSMRHNGTHQLALGNDSVRDYLHVDDVVAAYRALVARGRGGEAYNVASGVGVGVRQLASDILLRARVSADITTDPALVRDTDIPVLVGSPEKLMRDTGWSPKKTHADIIDDLLRFAHAATD
jgi:GDP-4-dehydro-6-deoxy-D-mannose reductase